MGRLLEGRVAVVTGAGSGIGRAEAMGLAAQGAKVVVNDIGTSYDGRGNSLEPAEKVVKEIVNNGGQAVPCYDSVATEEGAASIIAAAVKAYGKIDVLINNAGIVRELRPVYEIRSQDWDLLMKTHLFGTFYCTRAACALMKNQGYGRIINTSSHVGLGWKGNAAYGAAKEAIVGFTRTVARDMAEYGVTCNAIRPLAAWRGAKDISTWMLLNRPEEVASLVVYLASEQADHINGCIFEVWRGHVGIFTEPPVVREVISKDGSWTAEELSKEIPRKLTKGLSRGDFAVILHLD